MPLPVDICNRNSINLPRHFGARAPLMLFAAKRMAAAAAAPTKARANSRQRTWTKRPATMRSALELRHRIAPQSTTWNPRSEHFKNTVTETAPVSIPPLGDRGDGSARSPPCRDAARKLNKPGSSCTAPISAGGPSAAATEVSSPGPCAVSDVSAVSLLSIAITAAGSAESASPRADGTRQVLSYMCSSSSRQGRASDTRENRSYARELVAAYISSPRLARPSAAVPWTCAAFLGVPCNRRPATAPGSERESVVGRWIHRCVSPRRAGPMPARIAWEVMSGRTTLCLASQYGYRAQISQLSPWAAWLRQALPSARTVWWPWSELEWRSGGVAAASGQLRQNHLTLVYVVAVRNEASLRCDAFASVMQKARNGLCKVVLCLPPDFSVRCAQEWADLLSVATL